MARNDPPKAKPSSKKGAAETPAPAAEVRDADYARDRLVMVPLGELAVSPFNVRKTAAEVSEDDPLVASIRAHGLLQPLVGYLASSGEAKVLIAAGQRRLLALRHLFPPETPVAVRIVDEASAIEVSLAENLERKDMNPVDELDAFKALVDTGLYDSNRIADRFGFDRRLVRRRLKMAVLAPEILVALRDGTIGVGAAEAYAATDDQELQRKIFKAQSKPNTWNAHSPSTVLREILGEGVAARSPLGEFIGGRAAYEAEGGLAARDEAFDDLFASVMAGDDPDNVRLTDSDIVDRLIERAQAANQAKAEALAQDKAPFATSVEWVDLRKGIHADPPKPGKKSGLVLVQQDWRTKAEEFAGLLERAAAEGGPVIAFARIDRAGEIEIVGGAFHVGAVSWAAVKPETAEDERPTYVEPTPEEQAAAARERDIAATQQRLLGRSIIGDTPGFGITRCEPTIDERLSITLVRIDPGGPVIANPESGWPRYIIDPELLLPFLAEAHALVNAAEAKAAQDEQAAATSRIAVRERLAELGALAAAEWPAIALLRFNGEDRLTIARKCDVLELDDGEDVWTDEPESVADVVADQMAPDSDIFAELLEYDSAEAFEARLEAAGA